jgi:hypothetical protein
MPGTTAAAVPAAGAKSVRAPQQVRWVTLGQVPAYTPNGLSAFKLSRSMVYREVLLKLQLTIAASGTVTTALVNKNISAAGAWDCISSLQIKANGSDILRDFKPVELMEWQNKWYGSPTPPQGWLPFSTGGTTLLTFSGVMKIPLWLPNTMRPMDTALDSTQLTDLELDVNWSSGVNTIISSNYVPLTSGSVSYTSNPVLSVFALNSFNPYATMGFSNMRMYRLNDSVQFRNGAVSGAKIQIPVTQTYKGFLIHCYSDAATSGANTGLSVDTPNQIKTIYLMSGTLVLGQWDAQVVQEWYRSWKGQLRGEDQVGNQIEFGGLAGTPSDPSNYNRDAWYYFELCTDGYLSEAVPTAGLSELYLAFDTYGAIQNVTVVPLQIIPISQASGVGS